MREKYQKKLYRSGRGSIAFITIILAASAVFRLASGAGEAIAQSAENTTTSTNIKEDSNSTAGSETSQKYGSSREEMSTLLAALLDREAKLKEREAQIEMRSKALAVVDEEIAKRLVLLENIESELRSTLALADGAAENDLARLTSVYENMKPKDAAALFEAMEPDFAAGFLGRMRPDAAASVLAGLTPAAAYSISVILAGRNTNVPKS